MVDEVLDFRQMLDDIFVRLPICDDLLTTCGGFVDLRISSFLISEVPISGKYRNLILTIVSNNLYDFVRGMGVVGASLIIRAQPPMTPPAWRGSAPPRRTADVS